MRWPWIRSRSVIVNPERILAGRRIGHLDLADSGDSDCWWLWQLVTLTVVTLTVCKWMLIKQFVSGWCNISPRHGPFSHVKGPLAPLFMWRALSVMWLIILSLGAFHFWKKHVTFAEWYKICGSGDCSPFWRNPIEGAQIFLYMNLYIFSCFRKRKRNS